MTGADRGLGLALTASLLDQGWTVLAGQFLRWPELECLTGNLHILPLDIRSDSSVAGAALLASELVPSIDLVVNNAALNRSHQVKSIRDSQNFDDMIAEVNTNAIGALRIVSAFLPLLDRGTMKRLCFVSSEAGSIGASNRTGWFGYCMSKSALNMAVKNLSNDLIPQGYSFRLYHPGYMKTYMAGVKNEAAHMEPGEAAGYALDFMLGDHDPDLLAMIDWEGKEWHW